MINLKDLFYQVIRRWRSILCGALIIALLLGLFRLGTGLITMLDPDSLEAAEEQYQIKLDEYEAMGSQLRTEIANLRADARARREYNEKSMLMKIDPQREWVGTFLLYVDSQFQIDPNLSIQNTDTTKSLLAAYDQYLTGGEMYNDVVQQTQLVNEVRYLQEILEVKTDPDSATILVTCIGENEAEVQEILTLVKKGIQNQYAEVAGSVGKHSISVMMESCFTAIDVTLDEKQRENEKIVDDCLISISEANAELAQLQSSPRPRMEYGREYTVRQAVKLFVIGAVAGVVLMMFLLSARYVFSSTMKTEDDWNLAGLPVLTKIRPEPDRKAFKRVDHWIDRHFGGRKTRLSEEIRYQVTANVLLEILRGKGIARCAIVSDLPGEAASGLAEKLNAAGAGDALVYVGSLLSDPAAAKKLEPLADVILLGKNGETTMDEASRETTLLHTLGKNVLGVLVEE